MHQSLRGCTVCNGYAIVKEKPSTCFNTQGLDLRWSRSQFHHFAINRPFLLVHFDKNCKVKTKYTQKISDRGAVITVNVCTSDDFTESHPTRHHHRK